MEPTVVEPGKLLSLHVSLTTSCSRNCPMCKVKEKTGHHLSWAFLSDIVSQAGRLGIKFIAVGGGDPAYYPAITNLYAHPLFSHKAEKRIRLSTTTSMPYRLQGVVGSGIRNTELHISWDEGHVKGGFDDYQFETELQNATQYGALRLGVNHVVTSTGYLELMLSRAINQVDQIVLLSLKPQSWKVEPKMIKFAEKTMKSIGGNRKPSLLVDACSKECGQGKESMHLGVDGTFGACSHQTTGRIKYSESLENVWKLVQEATKDGECGYLGRHCPAGKVVQEGAAVQAVPAPAG